MNSCEGTAVEAAGFTDAGLVRADNQDSIMLPGLTGEGDYALLRWRREALKGAASFAVVDGMGGYDGGREAAGLCVAFLSGLHIPSSADEAGRMFAGLSGEMAAAGRKRGTPRMGAAIAMLTIREDEVLFANVGDCRIYHALGSSMGQMTVDDRMAEDSSGITQAIGPTAAPDSHFYAQPLQPGKHRFVLCSDGVWRVLGNALLKQLATSWQSPGETCAEIRKRVYELGADDNCSLVIVDVEKR